MARWTSIRNYSKPIKESGMNLLLDWARRNDIIACTYSAGNIPKMLRTGKHNADFPRIQPPYVDHGETFKDSNGNILFVFHPYKPIENICDEVSKWVIDHGLTVMYYDEDKSWYYPGRTSLVVISR